MLVFSNVTQQINIHFINSMFVTSIIREKLTYINDYYFFGGFFPFASFHFYYESVSTLYSKYSIL